MYLFLFYFMHKIISNLHTFGLCVSSCGLLINTAGHKLTLRGISDISNGTLLLFRGNICKKLGTHMGTMESILENMWKACEVRKCVKIKVKYI